MSSGSTKASRKVVVALLMATMSALLVASGALAGSSPPNNNFADAEPVGPLPATKVVDTIGATGETNEPTKCAGKSSSVWYRITPAHKVTLRVDSIGSDYDAAIAIWSGSTLDHLNLVACNLDIDTEGPHRDANALLAFTALADTRYYIQVIGNQGTGGNLKLHVRKVTPPPNDAFGDAKPITALPFHASFNNTNATTQPGEPNDCSLTAATRWYRFTPAHDMTVQADTFGSGIDTVVAVFTGTKVNALTYRACNDGTSQGGKAIEQASVTWHAKAGTHYGIQVGGFDNQTGPIELHVKRVTPAKNDDFGSSKVITTLPASLDAANRDATNQIGEPASECGSDNGLDQTRWYQFKPSTADDLQAEATAGPGAPGYVAIWTGSSLATLVEVDCSEDPLTFTPTPGTTYRFQVGMVGGHSGPMLFALSLAP